ncbi:sulfite exporter TauE/SafE family protein [Enterococcus phoeniculicola]|jgi:uncharacterized membrane protein YfcA|uniref:Probable membrane transporter protein n=1 Tax=Enterococcus phoeniculicola ATCC BAA-412 TaxID=1158610 RepID=R3TLK8_9ENTE|nr:sulfite exporter TauE/SafE family protein [Enterococcus phoeniculicola]EOL42359.1 sulfite exporter TauE/SafE [Enterococcus phoeniculicola ATCC BAA-412]EOT79362.1 sulfite exporter TauE/SafE [Enterococcus phoeniculicola ATCC BAA-412]
MIYFLYFFVIIFANTLGAISGMGGGVIIKPLLDLIGAHSVAAVSFYSSVAVFTMSIVSTARQMRQGISLKLPLVLWISIGALVGGMIGNVAFEALYQFVPTESYVQLIQIILTIITLLFAFFATKFDWAPFGLRHVFWYLFCGLILGFFASLLGIGGGPINVALLMLFFGMPIKEATVYSICTIFFSQLSKLLTITVTTGFERYDLTILYVIIPAAILGGLIGARFSHVLSPKKVTIVFQLVILIVLAINIYNGFIILFH